MLFRNIDRVKLFVLIAENIDINTILPLNSIIILYTNRKICRTPS